MRVQLRSAEGAEPVRQLEAETGAAGVDRSTRRVIAAGSPARKNRRFRLRGRDPPGDLGQIQAVARPAGSGVPVQSAARPPDQPERARSIAPFGMSDAHAQLGQTLPQVTLGGRRGFPPRLVHLVGGERPTFGQQFMRGRDGLQRWQRFLRHRLDALAAVRQRPTQPIPGTGLTGSAGRITIAVARLDERLLVRRSPTQNSASRASVDTNRSISSPPSQR